VEGLGAAGSLRTVPVGYWRNYLQPQGLAAHATAAVLGRIRAEKEAEERARLEERARAQAMATALATIGKFIIKKKVGDKGQIFGRCDDAQRSAADRPPAPCAVQRAACHPRPRPPRRLCPALTVRPAFLMFLLLAA
jgi:ribosomal protein L9